jgi:uncharacterized protein (TIGR02594 family)
MSWHKTAAVVTLMLAPMFTAGTDAGAASIVTSSSSSDAAWLATQLHQMHFAKGGAERSFDSYDRADASEIGDGPHVIGFHSAGSAGASGVVPAAERYRGTNPTGLKIPWCAVFANMILARAGFSGTGSAAARSFAQYGRPASGPAPGVIAVWPHHVGFVVGTAGPGRIRVVSGNHNHRVDESIYATRSVMAFRYPVRS